MRFKDIENFIKENVMDISDIVSKSKRDLDTLIKYNKVAANAASSDKIKEKILTKQFNKYHKLNPMEMKHYVKKALEEWNASLISESEYSHEVVDEEVIPMPADRIAPGRVKNKPWMRVAEQDLMHAAIYAHDKIQGLGEDPENPGGIYVSHYSQVVEYIKEWLLENGYKDYVNGHTIKLVIDKYRTLSNN